MDTTEQELPLVVIAQHRVDNPGYFAAVEAALKNDGRDCKVVANVRELVDCLRFARCFCVFISSDFAPDVVNVIRSSRQVSAVEWFLIAPVDNKKLSYRAIEAGVKGVLNESMTPFQYVQRARQVWAAIRPEDREMKFHKDVRSTGRMVQEVEAPPPPKPVDPLEGLELIRGSKDYRVRHPEWERIAQSQKTREFKGLDDLRTQCELDLLDLILSEPRSSLSLVSLKVKDPLVTMPPKQVRSLVSSNLLEDRSIVGMGLYPEMVSALELGRAVVIPDIESSVRFSSLNFDLVSRGIRSRAAIPLYSGDQIIGMIKVQFAHALNDRMRELLDDLIPFSTNLSNSFARIDFLSRVYEGANV